MSVTYILYRSRPSPELSFAQQLEIVADAARKNGNIGISGYMLMDDDRFVQWLEGASDRVEALFSKIAGDNRHQDVTVLTRGASDTRRFSEWGMGFAHSSKHGELFEKLGIAAGDPTDDEWLSVFEQLATHLTSEAA